MRRSEEYYRSVVEGKRKLIELRVCVECRQVDAQPGFQKCSKCRGPLRRTDPRVDCQAEIRRTLHPVREGQAVQGLSQMRGL